MMRHPALSIAFVLSAACGCGSPVGPTGSGKSPVGAPVKAQFLVGVAVIVPGGAQGLSWPVTLTVHVSETAGIGGYIEAVTTTIHRERVFLTYIATGPTRIPPSGQGSVQQVLSPPPGWETHSPEAPIEVVVRLRDDLGTLTELPYSLPVP